MSAFDWIYLPQYTFERNVLSRTDFLAASILFQNHFLLLWGVSIIGVVPVGMGRGWGRLNGDGRGTFKRGRQQEGEYGVEVEEKMSLE